MSALRVGELFAGYGGIGLGLKQLWPELEVAWVSDIDKGANKILAHRFPHAPNLGDITKVDWSTVEPVDIITGGFPCQDVSHAGRRAGLIRGETRSGLWAEMVRAIDTLRPRLVVAENVRGLLSARADSDVKPCPWCMGDNPDESPMRALGAVLADLADIGYDAAWTSLRASDVGACHGRFRVFILAWPADTGSEVGNQWAGLRASEPTGHGQRQSPRSNTENAALALLRTPSKAEDEGGAVHPDVNAVRGHQVRLKDQILALTGDLLPTPQAHDAQKGKTAAQVAAMRARGHGVANLNEVIENAAPPQLLPTPAVNDMGAGKDVEAFTEWRYRQKSSAGTQATHGRSLDVEVRLLPFGGAVRHELFGQYADAIARHEAAFGHPVPSPVEPTGKNGANRLSPRFTEWMMGLEAGWITDVPDITRNEALKACGNGVVPQQCAVAVSWLLNITHPVRHC